MPEYLVHVTASVLVSTGDGVVGEYTVRAGGKHSSVGEAVNTALAKASKAARTMAAGVDNTERNRLK